MKLDHWSQSSLGMINRCARQFYYRYIEGWMSPPAAALEFGTAYHTANERNFNHVIECGEDLSVPEVQQIFRDEFERLSERVEWRYEETTKDSLTDTGTSLVGEYIADYAWQRNPYALEKEFSFNIDSIESPFVGRIDFIGQEGYLLDHKTSGKAWNDYKLLTTFQPEAYYLAYKSLFGKYPQYFSYDVAVKTKSPYIQFDLKTTRTEYQMDLFVVRLKDAEYSVDKEAFPRTNPDSFLCSDRWCGYYNHCIRGVPMHQLRLRRENQGIGDEDGI